MPNNDKNAQALIIKRAAKWFVRLHDGDCSGIEYRRYQHWLNESPAHAAEMSRINRLHRLLRRTVPDV